MGAYPIYSVLDNERKLLYVSNDARCTVEVIDINSLAPKKISNFTSCPDIEYNSQSVYDSKRKILYTVAQHANSFAVIDIDDPTDPSLLSLLQDPDRSST